MTHHHTPRMGDIGEPRRQVEAPEPLPAVEPEPAHTPAPAREPEKVPA